MSMVVSIRLPFFPHFISQHVCRSDPALFAK
jgi:hypothetical protein